MCPPTPQQHLGPTAATRVSVALVLRVTLVAVALLLAWAQFQPSLVNGDGPGAWAQQQPLEATRHTVS